MKLAEPAVKLRAVVPDSVPPPGFAPNATFTGLFDVVYGVRLRDPFTMYKVFRSECLDGVLLTSDRFDFDWELVGKLVRLGFVPIEVPVSYQARSFSHGKKIRFFRDPPTWIAACVRFRFARLHVRPTRPARGEEELGREMEEGETGALRAGDRIGRG